MMRLNVIIDKMMVLETAVLKDKNLVDRNMIDSETYLSVIATKSVFVCLFILFSIVGNLSVLCAIFKYSYLQMVPNYFIASLAAADLLYSVFGATSVVITTVARKWILGDIYCGFIGVTNTWFCTTSIWTLVAISFNRHFAVNKPFKINKIYTLKRTIIIISLIWVLAFLVSIPPLFGWSEFVKGSNFCVINSRKDISYSIILICTNFIIPGLTLPIIYIKIYNTLKKQKSMFKKLQGDDKTKSGNTSKLSNANALKMSEIDKEVESTGSNQSVLFSMLVNITPATRSLTNTPSSSPLTRRKIKTNEQVTREGRVSLMLLFVVLAFFICWSPFVCATILYALNMQSHKFGLVTFGIVITCTNGVINPIIYGVMNSNFRKAYKQTYSPIIRIFKRRR